MKAELALDLPMHFVGWFFKDHIVDRLDHLTRFNFTQVATSFA